jgi:uncharacterized protein (DUF58 family)
MKFNHHLTAWLETHWATPAYSGWLLASLAICFFAAATNTMAGWLYVLSGVIVALLVLGAIVPVRSLRSLAVRRLPLSPVSAGGDLSVELEISNPTSVAKTLLQVQDLLPYVLAQPQQTAIEAIAPKSTHVWNYYLPTQRRGIYRWHEVQLRTGTPLGLFWCRRSRQVPAKAIVYPQVLPLSQCPLIDTLGQDDSTPLQSNHRYQAATEGVTKTLRPYRYGDPTRLIHWRTSARFEEFKVRELEMITGGQDVLICLDSAAHWQEETFELAVVAAASLYFYASRCQLNVQLWTAATGMVHGNRVVLETLAAVEATEEAAKTDLPALPCIWLTPNATSLASLAWNSRWLLFPAADSTETSPLLTRHLRGMAIDPEQPLQLQLQQPLR